MDDVEVGRVLVDQRLHERAAVADVAGVGGAAGGAAGGGGVGAGGRADVARGRFFGPVVVGELLDGIREVAGAHVLEVEHVVGDRRLLGQVALALTRLHGDVALPGEVRGILEAAGVLELDAHDALSSAYRPVTHSSPRVASFSGVA